VGDIVDLAERITTKLPALTQKAQEQVASLIKAIGEEKLGKVKGVAMPQFEESKEIV
jgi:hypothetical protein